MIYLNVLSNEGEKTIDSHNICIVVNGLPKPYSQVTEEDHDLMTPDEYTAYFEILQARS